MKKSSMKAPKGKGHLIIMIGMAPKKLGKQGGKRSDKS